MTEPTATQRVESFLAGFFGPGNELSLPEEETGPLAALVRFVRQPSDVPVVLPRRRPDQPNRLLAYVIAWDLARAALVGELLTAFVGPTYSFFEGLPTNLDPDDPVDRAVLEFVGPGTTFILRSPTVQLEGYAWSALGQMQQTVRRRPVRTWNVPKPVGQLLGEFEVALAAGDNTASAAVLDQLAATGGLGGANLNHLRIKRLARLGRDLELLDLPALGDVVAAGPPTPIRDAIFTALYNHRIAAALDGDDLDAARRGLEARAAALPSDLARDLTALSTDALSVVLLAADLRNDRHTLSALLDDPELRGRLNRHPGLLASIELGHGSAAGPPVVPTTDRGESVVIEQTPPEDTSAGDTTVPQQTIGSWVELVQAQAEGSPAAQTALRQEPWRAWPVPQAEDRQLAGAIAALDNIQSERVWGLVGPFVDADGFGSPAWLAATEFLQLALGHGWYAPSHLSGIYSLTEIILRASPAQGPYRTLLDDLRSGTDQWVSSDRARVTLDLADLLVRMPCPDHEARLRLALDLLSPLVTQTRRLTDDQRHLARQLDGEFGTNLAWPPVDDQPAAGPALSDLPALKVMLYSLDEGALDRVKAVLHTLAPQLDIQTESAHVGSPQLKLRAQHADVVILATRCATHSATGFIRANATRAIIDEADGSGSASLLRAATAALHDWLSKHHR